MTKIYSTTYSYPEGPIPSSTYEANAPAPAAASLNLRGLSLVEAQYVINTLVREKEAVKRRERGERKRYEAHLRRQGYDEEYIKTF